MENKVAESGIITALPPPPPPPPLPFSSFVKHKEMGNDKSFLDNSSNKDEQVSIFTFRFTLPNVKILSYCKSIKPVLQNGPTCGLVALSMASQYFQNIDAQDLLKTAKKLNFTKRGEMFSVYNMANLASSVINCDVDVICDLKHEKNTMLSHICSGWPVLIPYDKDKNNMPCLNNGLSAHWAVINGLCFSLPENYESELKFVTVPPGLKVHFADNGSKMLELLNQVSVVYVYAYQGKSKHMQSWDFDNLIQSNLNLFEATRRYASDEINLPENGILSELRDKAILLKQKT